MPVPETNFSPPFNITRASHVVLTTRDMKLSRSFYTEVIGLLVTHESDDEIYLRGVEETCHHSLILRRSSGQPSCETIGFRVYQDADLDRAKSYFAGIGIDAIWAQRPFQGRTLRLRDRAGMPIELVATMPTEPRLHDKPNMHKVAGALRYDHVQCLVPDVGAAGHFYTDIGFRISDYFVDRPEDDDPLGLFMFRKNNPHDLVLLTRPGSGAAPLRLYRHRNEFAVPARSTPPARSASRGISSAGLDGTGRGMCTTSISATRTGTALRSCRRRSRSSIWTTSRCAGIAATALPGICRHRRSGCTR